MVKRGVSKRGMTQEELVKIVVALVLLGILLFLAYKYVLKGSESAAKLGECESKPPQTCVARDDPCTGQKFRFGCPGDPNKKADDPANKVYCCVPESR